MPHQAAGTKLSNICTCQHSFQYYACLTVVVRVSSCLCPIRQLVPNRFSPHISPSSASHRVWLSPSSWVPPVNQLSVTVCWCWCWWCPSSGHLHRPGCLVTVRPISGSVIAESLASLYQSSAVGRHKHWYLTICMCGDNTVQPVYVVNVWTQLDTAGC